LLRKVGEGAVSRLLSVLEGTGEAGVEYVEPELVVGRSTVGPTLEPYDLL
jgi:LacI family transcriptional regulator